LVAPHNRLMLKRTLISVLTLASLAAPAAAGAADTVVVPGAVASRLTALDGHIVWTTGRFPSQTLMQRGSDGTVAPVPGAPKAVYRSIDLGHDASGKLVLTYLRCEGTKNCKAISDNLAGRRVSYKRLVPSLCALTSAPSRWNDRVAYGLTCDRMSGGRRVHDRARSGLFVRKHAGAAKRLRLPRDAVKFNMDSVAWVDLRGTNVGAGVVDVYKYAFVQTVNGSNLRSDFVGGSEGDSEAQIVGQSLGSGTLLWTLVDAFHAGDPNVSAISRIIDADCAEFESVENPRGPNEAEGYRYEAMAVDGRTMVLYAPGTGLVTHTFTPSRPCA